ncbi:MAG TPA: bacillithiol biosynthesis cysteine-adding enzyme BshC [Terriglobales bacterium]|nr:bacillithiol biosynthesis cysteine-adding enzyme BshC [Terriglobales bacterium]
MHSECLPFTYIPHTSRLFLDFLQSSEKVKAFYPRSARVSEWAADEAKLIEYPAARRQAVADLLESQNRRWGLSAKGEENLRKFRNGAAVAVSGQQVGVFGGPLFSILKAISAVEVAAQAESRGVPCIPIFWLATEDHDLAEVSKVSVPANDGSLAVLEVAPKAVEDSPVGDVRFGDEIVEPVQRLAELLGPSEVADALVQAYKPGERMGDAFAKLFASVFAELGIILIDAYDPEFHRIAEPIYRDAATKAAEIDRLLLARGKELEAAGYHQQVKVTSSSTLLFEIVQGRRQVVQRSNDHFKVGGQKSSKEELLGRIENNPELFSANVLLRPVMQDYLLPTLAYIGGPAEVAYFAQVGVVHEELLGRRTPVLARFSATIVEQKQQKLLEKYGLALMDFFAGQEKVRETMARRVLPDSLKSHLESADRAVAAALERVRTDLQQLDPTLVNAANRAEAKMRYQVDHLGKRAARAEILRNSIIERHAENLVTHLFPHKNLPEREIAGVYYVAKYGTDLLHDLYKAAQDQCPDHRVLYL